MATLPTAPPATPAPARSIRSPQTKLAPATCPRPWPAPAAESSAPRTTKIAASSPRVRDFLLPLAHEPSAAPASFHRSDKPLARSARFPDASGTYIRLLPAAQLARAAPAPFHILDTLLVCSREPPHPSDTRKFATCSASEAQRPHSAAQFLRSAAE